MHRPPVTDWTADFDHLDPTFVADPYPIYEQLRTDCPIAHTDRYHGVWIPTRYEDLAAIAHDPAWQVEVDGRAVRTARSSEGLLRFEFPAGRHRVEARFVDDRSGTLGLTVTLLAVVVPGALAIDRRRRGQRFQAHQANRWPRARRSQFCRERWSVTTTDRGRTESGRLAATI